MVLNPEPFRTQSQGLRHQEALRIKCVLTDSTVPKRGLTARLTRGCACEEKARVPLGGINSAASAAGDSGSCSLGGRRGGVRKNVAELWGSERSDLKKLALLKSWEADLSPIGLSRLGTKAAACGS